MRCPAVFNRAAWLFAALSALGAPLAQAQTTAGFADYFILGQDEHVWNLMNRVRVGEQAAAFPTPNRLNSAVAATATADGQIVIYDHWEDGLEANIQVPVQTSTLLLGDGINPNGRACDWTTDPRVFPCTGDPLHDDRLFAGTPLSFSSDQGMGGACAAPYAVPPDASQVRCSFPVSPVIVRLSRAAGTVTVQTEAAHPFVAGTSVRIAGANEPEYNGTFSVVASTSVTRAVTSLTQAGTTITATTPLAHGLAVGDLVSIEGATAVAPNSYNGVFTVATVGTPTTFTYTVAVASGSSPAGGVITASTYRFTYSIVGTPISPATGVTTVTSPTVRFDGGDRVFSVGGSLSIAHIQDPGTPLIGGGTELLARELVKNAVSYSIPVGEDFWLAGVPLNNVYQTLKYVALDIVAFDDNTAITVISPGGTGGTRSLVLHRGQHYTTCATFTPGLGGAPATAGANPGLCTAGAIDGPPPPSGADNRGVFPALALTVNGGTKISTSAPLNALIFTGGNGQYQTRHYATLPDILHSTDYVTTAPGPAVNVARQMDLFIYNPSTSSIVVTTTDTTGTTNITIPANSVVDYRNSPAARFVPANSSVRLTSSRPFWGLTAYDQGGLTSDWGHAWLGIRFLKSDYTVAYSPGTQAFPILSITHAAGLATVTTEITHVFSTNSSVKISGALVPTALTLLTSAGATATGTTAAAHGLVVGQQIAIGGAISTAPNNYNGPFTVATIPTANTFTYLMVAPSGSAPAGGASTVSIASILNGVRTITSTGAFTFTFPLAGASPTAFDGQAVGVCDAAAGPLACNAYNRDPVWVAGTQDNTQVRVDLNANGLWDYVDIDSDNCPDNGTIVSTGCETPPIVVGCPVTPLTPGLCAYAVNAPGSVGVNVLRVWDPTDQNNAGSRIVTSKPVALSWGQDVDQGQPSDPSPDNGYTIYPSIAIDLVLGITKTVNPARVPTAGGIASYNLNVTAGNYGPITNLVVKDTLPPGIACSSYVAGSTVLTYPDLSTTTVDPTCGIPATNIASLASAGATATATTNTAHRLAVGETITVAGAISTGPNNYNGTFLVVSIPNATTFTYTMSGASGSSPATGSITFSIPPITLSNLTSAGAIATGTTPANHGLIVGQTITISGATATAPNNYNGTFVVATVPTATTFTYVMTAASGSSPAGGARVLNIGRSQLIWSPTPNSLLLNQQLGITYQLNIPASSTRTLTNDAEAVGNLGSSVFNPKDSATLSQSDLTLTKGVTDDGTPEVGDILTYTLALRNGGTIENNVSITDIVPAFSSFVPGSINAAAPVTSITSAPAIAFVKTPVAHYWITGGTVTIAGAAIGAYNGAKVITVDQTVGITRAGAVATVTTPAAHGFLAGDSVVVSGANETQYNGTFVIATVTATTFTYTVAGAPATPATGTIKAFVSTRFSYTIVGNPGLSGGVITATPSSAGLAGAYSAGGNTVTWTSAFPNSIPANAVILMTFQVQINNSTPPTILTNKGNYSSTQTPSLDSNTVQTVIVGPIMGLVKSGPPGPVHPNDVLNFQVVVTNTGTGAAQAVGVTDNLAGTNLTYVAGSTTFSVNGGPFASVTDVVDADQLDFAGTTLRFAYFRPVTSITRVATLATVTTSIAHNYVNGNTVTIAGADDPLYNGTFVIGGVTATTFTYTMTGTPAASPATGPVTVEKNPRFLLNPGSTLTIRFRAKVDAGTAGLFAYNQASVFTTGQSPTPSNLYQVPIVNPSIVSIAKTSSGAGIAQAGQTLTYTVVVTNETATTQTGVSITDALPAGTTYVANSASVVTSTPTIRSTEYYVPKFGQTALTLLNSVGTTATGTTAAAHGLFVGQTVTIAGAVAAPNNYNGAFQVASVPTPTTFTYTMAAVSSTPAGGAPTASGFTGAAFSLVLNQNLVPNYFVVIQGSDFVDNATDVSPDRNYVSLTGDPFGTGAGGAVAGLANTGVARQLAFTRGAASLALATQSWSGVITVVECLNDCAASGFVLRDVGRIPHPLATVGPVAVLVDAAGQWTAAAASKIVLMGGFQGAGCDTAENQAQDTKGCHARLFPTGNLATSAINWTRDAAGALSLVASTSTVMIVQWGTQWTVQGVQINAAPAAAGPLTLATNYANSAALGTTVARQNTWVWGTGHTNAATQSNASEGVALTLGNGVVKNATETVLSAGNFNATALNFQVYALTHPSLVVDHQFKAQNLATDDTAATYDQVTVSGGGARIALSYQGNSLNDNLYAQSMFSARFLSLAQIRLERRRTGVATSGFAAWTQGINFSNLAATTAPVLPGHVPPNLVVAGDGFSIAPGGTLTLTYQVLVDNPLNPAITQISNTASFSSAQSPGPVTSMVVDQVARPAVRVEPNNAGFVLQPTAADSTILFTEGVTNLGTTADAFTVTLKADFFGWKVELLDPATGAVIATDSNGDGVWNGGVTISTGTLAVGATRPYTIRVTVPLGTAAATQNTVELKAVSAINNTVFDVGTDEITVLPAVDFGPVILLPDHSGIVTAGSSIAYTHRIYNNTGLTATMSLLVDGTLPGWTEKVYQDTNGDGVYTVGIDTEVTQTLPLPNGGSQILFVVTTAPGGATPGQDEVAHLTARNLASLAQVAVVSDTTTVLAATTHDLSGGGTQMAAIGDLTHFPGTLYNLSGAADRYDISLTASSLFGIDGLLHPTELWVDTNADGAPDALAATDTDGDGTWDSITAGFNTNANGQPDLPVPASGQLAYELRRQIPPTETIWLEYVTVTATSLAAPTQKDSITAEWLIASLSRASIRGLRVDPLGVVEFVTGTQKDTKSFNLYVTSERSRDGEKTLLNATPIMSPLPDSSMAILYRVETAPVNGRYLLIEETETTGNVLTYGPYSLTNTRLRRGLENVEQRMDRLGVPQGPVRLSRQTFDPQDGEQILARSVAARLRKTEERSVRSFTMAGARALASPAPTGLRIEVAGAGETAIPVATLRSLGMPNVPERNWRLRNGGERVPVGRALRGGVDSMVFTAIPLATDFTDQNVYVLSWGTSVPVTSVSLTASADPIRPGFTRIERNSIYSSAFVGDRWLWDILIGDGETWPYATYPNEGRFDLPVLAPAGPATVPVKIKLIGRSDYHHAVVARLNGVIIGSVEFDAFGSGLLEGTVPFGALRSAGNELTMVYTAHNAQNGPSSSGYAYLDYMDIGAPMTAPPARAVVTDLRSYDPTLPAFGGVKYLIVTHPLFRDQADRLAALKTAEGLKAAVVDTETAYDRFSAGVEDPRALAALIRHASRASGRLKYLVLFGDDNLDPRNLLGGGGTAYIPSILGADAYSLIPNDNAFADVNDDGRPDLATGRLPVSTIEEAAAVVDKIEGQTATLTASSNRHVFVNDDARETDSQFGAQALEMSSLLPAASTSVMADVGAGIGQARTTLFGAWRRGVTMTHYFGHGGPEIWTDEALFSSDDVPALQGVMPPMLLFSWACQTQFFQYYSAPSVSEALFLLPASGSLGSFGPAGVTSPARQREIYERVYRMLYRENLPIGELIRRAKLEALDASLLNQDVVNSFMYFGDPSLRIPRR